MKYNLLNSDFAYMFGFIQTDGSFRESYKNKRNISSYELKIASVIKVKSVGRYIVILAGFKPLNKTLKLPAMLLI